MIATIRTGTSTKKPRRFVDASRDKPGRRALPVLSLRQPFGRRLAVASHQKQFFIIKEITMLDKGYQFVHKATIRTDTSSKTLRRYVVASHDKPGRRALPVLSLRLPLGRRLAVVSYQKQFLIIKRDTVVGLGAIHCVLIAITRTCTSSKRFGALWMTNAINRSEEYYQFYRIVYHLEDVSLTHHIYVL
ncbi:hypothetical protein [Bacillus sp. FJAT-22090]|uniref:hypothetical protein n=1 Tax=Bacillus sp. FJAT-22090 TaxID=1581038 RepID=UPI000A555495|nr:hypothetical protein [Bacillus sp. FJAT-22090]